MENISIGQPTQKALALAALSGLKIALGPAFLQTSHRKPNAKYWVMAALGEMLRQVDARFRREKLTFGLHNHWFRDRKFEYQSVNGLLRSLDGCRGRSA